MGFVLLIEKTEKTEKAKKADAIDDEFKEYRPARTNFLDPDKAYLSIKRQCRNNNVHNYRYCFTIGKTLATKAGIETPSRINIAFSNDGLRIKLKQSHNGKWKFSYSSLSVNSRVTIVVPCSPYDMEMKTQSLDIEKIGNGELILNIEEAVKNHGY